VTVNTNNYHIISGRISKDLITIQIPTVRDIEVRQFIVQVQGTYNI